MPQAIPFIIANAALISAGVSAAGTALSMKAQNDQAQAQMNAAADSNNQQQAAMRLQQVQINQAASEEARQRAAQTNRELAKFMVASGASGLSGVSLDRQQVATGVGEQLDLGVLEYNRENRLAQSQLQALGIQAQAQGRINEAEANSIGPLQGILGITQGAVSGYQAGSNISGSLSKRFPQVASTPKLAPVQGPQPFMLSGWK